ncbi:MAG TPA: exodeoxyribonuclease V subunit gamma, partial [Rhodanobacteraceae bacterium]|nr:exodeoxyribonuclease V subunit gamma [Rhodanobacteraceae bacterium]
WGRAGRDFIETLFSYELVTPREIEFYAEPEKPHGLLQRLQLDLLERRAPRGPKIPLAEIERGRSLQMHACHTRLREVEVLHDQLRAMFEEDPALEARDVAVMAPDINLYAPYIAAVFGGAQSTPRFIPYTVADESALIAAPVADLVLRILDLAQSRLTSNDVLDLIAMPPLTRRFDLDTESIDRLRDWIKAAGARWGLDAAHRARLGAPADDAFTWRFALDRLLLGHAAGDDADVAGVAPWPHLEGIALDALIHLLAVLERAAAETAQAHTPPAWQALITRVLEELLPPNASDVADQRARDRVFAEIDAFGRAAEDAGLRDALPPDVVRAHFAARFAEADARQPFLAGGVTFCRMVPMRLIPFRVIAILGLNDRDYPRQEASPVLNRLAAALDRPGSRRRGDRSVRDDDRFLFLQLLTAADRVLYLSYIAHDAFDGSAREPSVVVSELLDVCAAYFDEPATARCQLIVQHPLQPFGKSLKPDARRVRFDASWSDALQTAPAAHPLPAFVGAPLSPDVDAIPVTTVDYLALKRFLIDAPRIFLRDRLAIRLDEDEAHLPDAEPFVPADALERFGIQRRVYAALLADASIDESALCRRMQAEAELPPGAAGLQRLREIVRQARPIVRAVHAAQAGDVRALPFTLPLGDVVLSGVLDDVDDAHALRVKIGKPGGRDVVRWNLDALVLAALGDPRSVLTFGEFEAGDIEPRPIAAHPPEAARAALAWLAGVMRDGNAAPLSFRPSAAWTWLEDYAKNADEQRADAAAADAWTNRKGGGEGTDACTMLALRGATPFDDETATHVFRRQTLDIFSALLDARVPGDAS